MSLASRIKESRKAKHYTQKDLAKLLNVKPTTVSGWELGRNDPSIETLKQIAKFLGVDFDYLADVSSDKKSNDTKHVDLEKDPVVLSYGGKPISEEDMEIIKAILRRHKGNE